MRNIVIMSSQSSSSRGRFLHRILMNSKRMPAIAMHLTIHPQHHTYHHHHNHSHYHNHSHHQHHHTPSPELIMTRINENNDLNSTCPAIQWSYLKCHERQIQIGPFSKYYLKFLSKCEVFIQIWSLYLNRYRLDFDLLWVLQKHLSWFVGNQRWLHMLPHGISLSLLNLDSIVPFYQYVHLIVFPVIINILIMLFTALAEISFGTTDIWYLIWSIYSV